MCMYRGGKRTKRYRNTAVKFIRVLVLYEYRVSWTGNDKRRGDMIRLICRGNTGHREGRVTPSSVRSTGRRPTQKSTRDDRGDDHQPPKPAHHHHHLSISQKKSRKRKRKKMIVSTLRRSLQRTHAPHRRLPFSTSTSSASTSSSSSSSSNSASAAQKKAQDALGNVSAVFMRAGTYARSALGPFGARLSGLLGCQYTHIPLPSPSAVPFFFTYSIDNILFFCSVSATDKVQLCRDARNS